MISFFIKFYIIVGLVYVTYTNTDDTRVQRVRGRPKDDISQEY